MNLAVEEVDRYRELARAQLRCARWEAIVGDSDAVASFEAAFKAVEKATRALPRDGSVRGQDFDELLQPLVILRGDITEGLAEARARQSASAKNPLTELRSEGASEA